MDLLKPLRGRLRQKATVTVYPNSGLDDLIEWVTTKTGLSAFALVACGFLAIITASLLIYQMQHTEHLNGKMAYFAGAGISILFEMFSFICAVNGFVWGSFMGIGLSIIILRGTFGSQFFYDNTISLWLPDTWNFPYFLSWVMSIAFPVIIGYIAHAIKKKMEHEELALAKLKVEDPAKYREITGENF